MQDLWDKIKAFVREKKSKHKTQILIKLER